MKRNSVIFCVLVFMLLFLTACARDAGDSWLGGMVGDRNDAWYDGWNGSAEWDAEWDDAWVAAGIAPPAEAARGGGASNVEWEDVAGQNERHLIQTASVEAETEYFDDTVAALRALPHEADGYVESEMLTTRGRRVFTIVMRVPAGRFEAVLAQTQALVDVRHTNRRAEDVTDRFYDMAGSLETRRIEEERLLALIEEAENIHDLLALESRLSDTRQVIESYLSALNRMAGQIAFSTITVTLFDVSEEEYVAIVPTLGERIGGAFGDSVDGVVSGAQNIIVFFAGAVIPLLILGVFALAGVLVYKAVRKKYRVKNDVKNEA